MELSKLDPMLTAAFIAISGHMGTRLIFLAEEQLIKRFGLDTQCELPINDEDKNNGGDFNENQGLKRPN
jgi:hypothetical protein